MSKNSSKSLELPSSTIKPPSSGPFTFKFMIPARSERACAGAVLGSLLTLDDVDAATGGRVVGMWPSAAIFDILPPWHHQAHGVKAAHELAGAPDLGERVDDAGRGGEVPDPLLCRPLSVSSHASW